MKIVRIIGGLGNQMFQYALYLALKTKFPAEDIKIDISCFNSYKLHNGFELGHIFNVDLPLASFKERTRLTWPTSNFKIARALQILLPHRPTECFEATNGAFDKNIFIDRSLYYSGYWQHEEYFKSCSNLIRNTFSFRPFTDSRNVYLMNKLANGTYVSVHIRRGDYLKHRLYIGTCPPEYYRRAISIFRDKMNVDGLVVFSNDIEWCHDNLHDVFNGNDMFVDWNNGYNSFRDMQLMSLCKHNIIANSSFSWWGAWLNPNSDKIVVAPDKWYHIKEMSDPICKNWLRI